MRTAALWGKGKGKGRRDEVSKDGKNRGVKKGSGGEEAGGRGAAEEKRLRK